MCVVSRHSNFNDLICEVLSSDIDFLTSFNPSSLFLICGDLERQSSGVAAKTICETAALTQSVFFLPYISSNGSHSLLDVVTSNFLSNLPCCSSAPLGFSNHIFVKVFVSFAIFRELPRHRHAWHFDKGRFL